MIYYQDILITSPKTPTSISGHFPFPLPWDPDNPTNPLSVLTDGLFHTFCAWLLFLSIHPSCSMCQYFIPFYG